MRSIVTRPAASAPSRSLFHFYALQRGLSKVQLLAAIAVVAIIVIVAAPRLMSVVNHVHNPDIVIAEQDLGEIQKSLASYKQDNGNYPSTEQGLLALVIKPSRAPVPKGWKTGGYIDRLPHDPWGHSYQYRLAPEGDSFDVFSFGAHGPDEGDDNPGVIRAGQH